MQHFFTKRTTQETPWTETISQNKLPLFLDKEKPSKQKATIVSLKEERSQIMHLMLSGQSGRDVDEDVFSHENSKFPPSLTRNEEIYTECKSKIVNCIEEDIHFDCQERPASDVVVLDGALIVQILKPGDSATFEDYANIIFIPYILPWLNSAHRIDVVWDMYKPDSLKSYTRKKRGAGVRRQVKWTTLIPGNWRYFLCVDENKSELFSLLAQQYQFKASR